jgi:tRNA uridine 5-carboxymethylaminomethyl modification enzyme
LIDDAAWADYLAKQERLAAMKQVIEKTRLTREMIEKIGDLELARPAADQRSAGAGEGACSHTFVGNSLAAAVGAPVAQLLRRPEVRIDALSPVLTDLLPGFFIQENPCESVPIRGEKLSSQVLNELRAVETEIKYAGYLDQQQKSIERLKKSEQRTIPEWFDYKAISGLSREMQEKLQHVRPQTLGQASRIPGVTPAAVSLVNVYIEIQGKRIQQARQLGGD